ncbi:hypothetical protein CROQUDRAFT_98077 [Cronartium quercuum f. sp. fusiforme G11]|uniref:Uncharacterized protein n=1 Tax=Cronartium quercuum f. sp. fusiforme G11 TaxID=708437 RepID=A0A9P6NE59_9BASI|nr:hypothetical protein CROQUDRAFT_98077 [Cronartium quercuum f. sp. fusiforme G11]
MSSGEALVNRTMSQSSGTALSAFRSHSLIYLEHDTRLASSLARLNARAWFGNHRHGRHLRIAHLRMMALIASTKEAAKNFVEAQTTRVGAAVVIPAHDITLSDKLGYETMHAVYEGVLIGLYPSVETTHQRLNPLLDTPTVFPFLADFVLHTKRFSSFVSYLPSDEDAPKL